MDRLEAMNILLAIAEAGSFSAAARKLKMPLPTVSRKIAELETHLKVRLLIRTTRQVALTEAGVAYLAAARRILEEVGEAERAAAGEYASPRGLLTLTAPVVFGRLHLMPVVADFLKLYADITIQVSLADHLSQLIEEHIDVAVRIGELPDSSLVAIKVGEIRRVVCASPSYLAARGVPVQPADLSRHDCIAFTGLNRPHEWEFRNATEHLHVAVQPRLIVNTADAAIEGARQGLGLACVLSYQVADSVRRGELQLVLEAFEPAPWPLQLVYAARTPLPLKLRAFLDFAAQRLPGQL